MICRVDLYRDDQGREIYENVVIVPNGDKLPRFMGRGRLRMARDGAPALTIDFDFPIDAVTIPTAFESFDTTRATAEAKVEEEMRAKIRAQEITRPVIVPAALASGLLNAGRRP